MTQDNTTEGNEPTDESMENESEVFRSLRKERDEAIRKLKNAPTRESIEAEIRTELERQSAISEQLVALGHPGGLSEFLNGKLGDSEVTRESVAQALQGIGYQVEVEGATSETEDSEPSETESDLAKVTNLSAQVRSAARGGDPNDTMRKINQANTPEELQAVMAEIGAVQSHI